jgi:small subunit ribosomal protein S18
MPRRWQPGDVYSPHDLSPAEMRKWRRHSPRTVDIVDTLGLEPKDMYKVCNGYAMLCLARPSPVSNT